MTLSDKNAQNANKDARNILIDYLSEEKCDHNFHRDKERGCPSCRKLADFILERERKIVEPLVKVKNASKTNDLACEFNCLLIASEEVLKRAGLNS